MAIAARRMTGIQMTNSLSRKDDVRVYDSALQINDGTGDIPKSWDLGNGSWGMIDKLKILGYRVSYVPFVKHEKDKKIKRRRR